MFAKLDEFASGQAGWLHEVIVAAVAAGVAVLAALVVHSIVFRVLRKIAHASESESDDLVIRRMARPTRYALVALGIVLAAREIPLLEGIWQKIAGFVMPALLGWIALSVMRALIDALELRADISDADNSKARRTRTRLAIFSRIGSFLIIFITVGLMLLSIPGVRDIGVTLMASAGLAALAVGAAAQPALKALIAGFQMALTEPISIDDVVIVDGEWGRIEDIRTTYVIVRTWDERRLVVPTTRFLEDTFQNWTRNKAELLAPVFLHLDPLADIDTLRAEFLRQVECNELWDKRVAKCQVTESDPDSIEVRFLMSAHDASTAFDLRCEVRESMLAWIRQNMPGAIARRRIEAAEWPAAPVPEKSA
ncbi:MAG: mechanosensitive ion channel family protein [Novosphingobium sp.]|nr:mechanosensitive ion channel family protein [Novosphingobium sp.]